MLRYLKYVDVSWPFPIRSTRLWPRRPSPCAAGGQDAKHHSCHNLRRVFSQCTPPKSHMEPPSPSPLPQNVLIFHGLWWFSTISMGKSPLYSWVNPLLNPCSCQWGYQLVMVRYNHLVAQLPPAQPPSNAGPWPHLRVERKATATSLQAGSSAQHAHGTSSCQRGSGITEVGMRYQSGKLT